MKNVSFFYRSFLIVAITVLASCVTQPTLNGLWQSTHENGTIEFKSTGEVIFVDNLSATVIGNYQVEENELITFEIIATDILRDSIQPTPKTVIKATINRLTDKELQLRIAGEDGIESYRRIR